jgi:hypothetical protein
LIADLKNNQKGQLKCQATLKECIRLAELPKLSDKHSKQVHLPKSYNAMSKEPISLYETNSKLRSFMLFDSQQIRPIWNEFDQKWYFPYRDAVQLLTKLTSRTI